MFFISGEGGFNEFLKGKTIKIVDIEDEEIKFELDGALYVLSPTGYECDGFCIEDYVSIKQLEVNQG